MHDSYAITPATERSLRLFLACGEFAADALRLACGALDLLPDTFMLSLIVATFCAVLDAAANAAAESRSLVENLRQLEPDRPEFDRSRYSSPVLAERAKRREALCWPCASAWRGSAGAGVPGHVQPRRRP